MLPIKSTHLQFTCFTEAAFPLKQRRARLWVSGPGRFTKLRNPISPHFATTVQPCNCVIWDEEGSSFCPVEAVRRSVAVPPAVRL